jgi:hypothetical protein
MPTRQLEEVDYLELCASSGFQPCGVHKTTQGGKPAVLISPYALSYVADILAYKFEGYQQVVECKGLMAAWDAGLEVERDRFYIMCAYLLRYAVPDIWESISGAK